ncbi:MAG: DbpA RNA binding domain-containing protein, partial [Myxococcaceae bacterium]|nr:DbpA RNA binding domain-containing protein [Myxococcaceae bacterium]
LQAGGPLPVRQGDASSSAPAGGSEGAAANDERRERRPRRDRPKAEVRQAEPGQVRLWVNLGSADGLDAAALKTALEGGGAQGGQVQHVELLRSFSYVFVPEAAATAFEGVSGKPHGSRQLKVERAKK